MPDLGTHPVPNRRKAYKVINGKTLYISTTHGVDGLPESMDLNNHWDHRALDQWLKGEGKFAGYKCDPDFRPPSSVHMDLEAMRNVFLVLEKLHLFPPSPF